MNLSTFGRKFTTHSGILQLMDDLGRAMAGSGDCLMLGGGNPSHIPEVEQRFRRRLQEILDNNREFSHVIGDYDCPQGKLAFIESLAELLRRTFGWPIDSRHVAITLGSQTSFFALFNMFAGPYPDGRRRKILLPLAPEYIGYADVGLVEDFFVSHRPRIEHLDTRLFKYHVDFDSLRITEDIGAICVSRPTNPTGNVLTDEEIERLDWLAKAHGIPLIIDNAYGTPFPNIVFTRTRPIWNDNMIVCMSLSKLGLPGTRTGIVIAREEIIRALTAINAIISLAPGSFGAALALPMVRSGEILTLSRDIIRPYYQRKAEQAVAQLRTELDGTDFYIHKPEGALFLWLWLRNLPLTSQEFYERLKRRRVLVVPGRYFFPGLPEPWRHKEECIRITYSQDETVVQRGLSIIAEEARRAYAEG